MQQSHRHGGWVAEQALTSALDFFFLREEAPSFFLAGAFSACMRHGSNESVASS